MKQKRVLTGMRTTGLLHLGHYVGALKQWLEIQKEGGYECYFLLADVQALTTHADHPEQLTETVRQVALDWCSVGILPNINHFVLQSMVPARYELSVLLSMIAGYKEVTRNPTVKAELKAIRSEQPGRSKADISVGFMTYPVDQAADIYMISPIPPSPGNEVLVPVGADQVPHLELAIELAKRFNRKYGEVFVPCTPLVGEIGRLVGIDGQSKMSKSANNAIYLADDPDTIRRKVMAMFTDPNRIRADIPGETEKNPVFIYHRAFNDDPDEVAELTERYQQGKVGDVEVKKKLIEALERFLEPVRRRRADHEIQTNITEHIIEGTRAAQEACVPVIEGVREKMYLKYP